MSGSNKSNVDGSLKAFIKDENGWADFFITRIGLILFTTVLLLCALKIYPLFHEQEMQGYLDSKASDIALKLEAVDSTSIPGYRYLYSFDEKNRDVRIGISTEYVSGKMNRSAGIWGEREETRAKNLVTHVYPPNAIWSNTSGFRQYISLMIGNGKSGDMTDPLDFSRDKARVDFMFDSVKKELARNPFMPDTRKPMIMEKVIIYYTRNAENVERDYVFVYQ